MRSLLWQVLLLILCSISCIFAKAFKEEPLFNVQTNIANEARNVSDACILDIVPEEIDNVKAEMIKVKAGININVVYIHITNISSKENPEFKDRMLEWQYVNRDEKFLLQLPVDFDMVTFSIFYFIGEEGNINIPMKAQNTDCNYTEATIQSIKLALWKQLLSNFSDNFVLCNRISDANVRKYIYWVTTIWMGYDLTCSTESEDYVVDVGKFSRPNIIPVVCFILSLQYIWIYAFIKFKNEKSDFHYEKGDIPYSLKRVVEKFLYSRWSPTNRDSDNQNALSTDSSTNQEKKTTSRESICDQIDSPAFRITAAFYLLVLLPVSLYRTIYRWHLSKAEEQDYLAILKPSEPLCSLSKTDCQAYTCDLLIAIFSTILGICFVFVTLNIFFGKMCGISRDENENDLLDVFKGILEPIRKYNSSNGDKISEKSQLSDNSGNGDMISEKSQSSESIDNSINGDMTSENSQSSAKSTDDDKIEADTKHYAPKSGPNCKGEVSEKTPLVDEQQNDGDIYSCCKTVVVFMVLCGTIIYYLLNGLFLVVCYLLLFVIFLFGPYLCFLFGPLVLYCQNCSKCKKSSCCGSCDKQCCMGYVVRIFRTCFILLTMSCLVFSQRSIVSSITFLLRLMTYFIFVALPARINLFRYFLIVVTALGYVFKYHAELVKMASEVLEEIFKQKKKRAGSKQNLIVEEKLFEEIMKELKFSYRWYFFIIKCLVLIVYIFITVEALVNSYRLTSLNYFGDFISFLFIVVSPAIAQQLYKTRQGYLDEKHRKIIEETMDKTK